MKNHFLAKPSHTQTKMPWPELPPTHLAAIKRRGSWSISRDLQGAHPQVHQLSACCRDGASNSFPPHALPGPGGSRPLCEKGTVRVGCTGWRGQGAVAAGTSAEFPAFQCSLTGRWVNDLGSNMTIETVNANGDFTGTYHTAVSASPQKIKESPLVGSQHLSNQQNQPTFGFTVHWNFSGT